MPTRVYLGLDTNSLMEWIMKSPRLIRPLLLIGSIVIALSVLSFLMIPAWRHSSAATLVLVLTALIGLFAVAHDIKNLARELREFENHKPDSD